NATLRTSRSPRPEHEGTVQIRLKPFQGGVLAGRSEPHRDDRIHATLMHKSWPGPGELKRLTTFMMSFSLCWFMCQLPPRIKLCQHTIYVAPWPHPRWIADL